MKKKLLIIMAVIFCFIPITLIGREIKPGITITQDNYREYLPELKRLLDPGTYRDAVDALERGTVTLPIVETREYPQYKPYHKYSMKYEGTCRIGPNNELIGWKAGLPFLEPRSGAELCWNLDRKGASVDQGSFYGDFFLFDKSGEMERKCRWHYWNFYYNGRVAVDPIHEVPGNKGVIRMKEAFLILNPFDLRGFSFIRTRYEDIFKPDDVFSYIPAIRRLRRLTGSDVCDPMMGTDAIYDDFEMFRQKITSKMTFRMSEREILIDCQTNKRLPLNGNFFQTEWEIRPVYVLEIYPNDPDYIYSKRVIFMDKQRKTGVGNVLNTYDLKGRLNRGQILPLTILPPYYHGWSWYSRYDNHLTGHSTVLKLDFKNPDLSIRSEQFSFRWLIKQAR